MKKLTMFLCLTMFVGIASGQTLRVSLIDEFYDGETKLFCVDTLIVYVDSACWLTDWYRPDHSEMVQSFELVVTESQHQGDWIVSSIQCGIETSFAVYISSPTSNAFNPFDEPFVWKRRGDTITLGNPDLNYLDWQWSTNETTTTIDVVQDGTYSATNVNDPCGPKTYSIQVRDNVEVGLATCDLETNLNMVTWPTTPAQAEYVSQVEVRRDGLLVGTAPYTDGQFIDNIGSDAASRTYTVTAIATDGTPCPITSYPKETIHMAYLTGINNTIEVNWNAPTGYDLLGYNICKYTPGSKDGDLTVIDFVGASVTSYTCSESQFDEGYIVVQGVEAGKDGETRLLSNRSMDLVGIGEKEKQNFNIYPNPSAGRVTVEGTGRLTITNTLGQTILTRDITDTETIDLPRGVWFVKLNGATRKVVVE